MVYSITAIGTQVKSYSDKFHECFCKELAGKKVYATTGRCLIMPSTKVIWENDMWNEMGNDTVHDAGNNTGNNTLILASIMNVLLFGVGVYFASYDLVDYEYWLWPFIIRDGILMGLPIITLVVLCRIRNQKRITNIKRVLYYLAIMGNVLVLGMTFLMFAMTRIDPGDPLFFLIVLSSILIATPTVNLMVLSRVFKKRQTFHPERRREFGQ